MALSLSNFLYAGLFLLLRVVLADTVNLEFNISWVHANPDGLYVRPVMGINNQWPIPAVKVKVGDQVVVKVYNGLGNETTSLHWHGLFMNGTIHMDGPVGVTQCAIPTGGTFTYNFTIQQPGTYWFHSHVKGQYPDGLRAPLIVEDPDSPFKDQYDEEIIISFSDWYHDLMKTLLAKFISVTNPTGAEPVPNSALMNDTQNLTVFIQPGKTYLLRMVNMAAFAGMYVWFEGHTMRIIEVDGVYTEPANADMIYLSAAQRYSVLITAKNSTDANFPIIASMDEDLFDTVPDTLNPNVTGWLVYDSQKPLPDPTPIDSFDPFDDFTLAPQDGEKLFDNVDRSITFDLKMDNLGDGANYAFMNDITYVAPKVPTLYTVMTTGESAANPEVYGTYSHTFVIDGNQTVELILNNNDPGKHPFHLHGQNFQVVARPDDETGNYDPKNTVDLPAVPMRRDTILVRPNSYVILRFRSDNPGTFLWHCHVDWHLASGLAATLIVAPLQLQKTLQIPEDHFAACAANSPAVPTSGNAAANTVDFLNLDGQPTPPAPLPAGFTARGIVALVFSCLCACLGIAVIGWYGAQPLGKPASAGVLAPASPIGDGAGKSAPAAEAAEGQAEEREITEVR